MKANEIKNEALALYARTSSANEIKAAYKELAEKYGKEDARSIVDKAREIRSQQNEKVTNLRNSVLSIVDEKALVWAFDGLRKEKEFKKLANLALVKCEDVAELVAKWYPHTIDGIPARKVTKDDGTKVWEKKMKINPTATLKACLRQMAKSAKGAKAGTKTHTEGEIAE